MFQTLLDASASGTQTNATASLLGSLLPLAIIILLFYFMLIRPQKRKEKEAQAMRQAVEVGDEIVTIGGIVGLVVYAKPESDFITIETGSDRSKLTIQKWAIQQNNTPHEAPAQPEKEKKADKAEKKSKKELKEATSESEKAEASAPETEQKKDSADSSKN